MHFERTTCLVGTEVRVAQHGNNRSVIKEPHSLVCQFCNIYQGGGIRVTVDQGISQEVGSLFRIQDVHRSEVVVFGTNTDYFFGHFDCITVFSIQSGDESVGISGFHHHHTEVITLKHFIRCFVIRSTFTGTFFGQYLCITFAAFCFAVVAQIDNFDTLQA